MKILIFDIRGKAAHFRKYYTNSSSLTYTIPPRTALMGIIGAMLGYERDSYYEILNSNKANIAIKKLENSKKIIQTVNYMLIKTPKDIIEPKKHTQIPFEILAGEKGVGYRVYFHHENKDIMDDLENRIRNKKYYYSPYLGAAPFSCHAEFVDCVQGNFIEKNKEIYISTAVNNEYIVKNSIDIYSENLVLMREKMPKDFTKERYLQNTASYIFDDNGIPIKMELNICAIGIQYNEENCREEFIIFL